MLVLQGIVESGVGEGASFMGLAWVREAVRAAAGFDPYPGTLNVRIDEEALPRWRALRASPGLRLVPPPTAPCGGRLFPIVVAGNVPAAVVVPDVTRYGDDLLEVVAGVHLRSRLGLRDGDVVTLSVAPEIYSPR